MKLLVILLFFSLLINIAVFFMDTVPFLLPKIKRKLKIDSKINSKNPIEIEEKIVDAAMKMICDKKVKMVWSDKISITERVFNFIRKGTNYQFKTYNYPRAFLYNGLMRYYVTTNNTVGIENLKLLFDKLIKGDGNSNITLDKVDQATFGVVAIELYKIYNEKKYQLFYEELYSFLTERVDDKGLILYRKGQSNQLNDLIGMIVPFLVEYYKITDNSEALAIAKKQLEFYIEYGVDKETFLPSHGVHLVSKVKTGSINWGRGIGWYLLGLSTCYEATGEYEKEFVEIKNSLEKLQLENKLYSQFPGSNNCFDASTSTMFLYSFAHLNDFNMTSGDVLTVFSEHIDNKGRIMETSGDTYGLNSYSETFGLSELSQGMLLLLLSKTIK